MFAQCPSCETIFRISEAQLSAREGLVRCGQCQCVFNAAWNLVEMLSGPRPQAQRRRAEPQPEPSRDEAIQAGAGAERPEPVPEPPEPEPVPEPGLEPHEAEPPPEAPELEPAPAQREPIVTESIVLEGDSFTIEREEAADSEPQRVEPTQDVAPALTEPIVFEPAPQEPSIEPEQIEPLEPEPQTRTPATADTDEARARQVAAAAAQMPEPVEIYGPPAPEPAQAAAPAQTGPAVEPAEALPEETARPQRVPRLLWALGCLGATALLGAQAVYFYFDAAAQAPGLRPWLERACRVAGCRLAPLQDLARIDLLETEVHPHPRSGDAVLRVRATLVNRADFAQPFPLLELSLTDRRGRTVARRAYTPAEYLGRGSNDTPVMPVNIATEIVMDIKNPDPAAVGYEIQLVQSPRASVLRGAD